MKLVDPEALVQVSPRQLRSFSKRRQDARTNQVKLLKESSLQSILYSLLAYNPVTQAKFSLPAL
jgi:hypothetical protein